METLLLPDEAVVSEPGGTDALLVLPFLCDCEPEVVRLGPRQPQVAADEARQGEARRRARVELEGLDAPVQQGHVHLGGGERGLHRCWVGSRTEARLSEPTSPFAWECRVSCAEANPRQLKYK